MARCETGRNGSCGLVVGWASLAPVAGALAVAGMTGAVHAQAPFAGKTVSILVGSAAGGSYDLYARTVARHIGKSLPGAPSVIVQNMQGANSAVMATHLYNAAAKDGTVLGAPLNTLPVTELLEPGKLKLESAKFNWIGAVSSPANVLAMWHTSGIKTLADAQQKDSTIGATTPGTSKEMYPLLTNALFGTKFKVVTGYKGSTEVNIAMERGEVGGHGANYRHFLQLPKPRLGAEGKLHYVFQMTEERDAALKGVPTLLELAKTDEQKKIIMVMVATEAIGRSMFAPPGMDADRVALLRSSFDTMLADKEFLAEVEKAKLEVQPDQRRQAAAPGRGPDGDAAGYRGQVQAGGDAEGVREREWGGSQAPRV